MTKRVGLFGLLMLFIAVVLGFLLYPQPVRTEPVTMGLKWTAPGDDGNVGQASYYHIYYSTNRNKLAINWTTCDTIPNAPHPSMAGVTDSVRFTIEMAVGETTYFAVVVCDEQPNCSGLSNIAWKWVPDNVSPSDINDLRVID